MTLALEKELKLGNNAMSFHFFLVSCDGFLRLLQYLSLFNMSSWTDYVT